jgi:hypothetical protein
MEAQKASNRSRRRSRASRPPCTSSTIGPGAWHEILEDVAGRNEAAGDATADDLFATDIGKLILHPFNGFDGYPISVLSDETRAWLSQRGYTVRTKTIHRVSGVARRLRDRLPKREVIRLLGGRNGPGITRAYAQVVKELDRRDTNEMTDDQLAEVLLDRVRELMTLVQDHVSVCAVAETLCSRYRRTGGSIWVDPRLLKPLRIEHVMDSRARGDVFARDDLEAMQARLMAATRLVDEDRIPEGFAPYGNVSGSTTSTFYGGADLIVDILSGDVPAVRTVPIPTLADLWIATRAVEMNVLSCRVSALVAQDRYVSSSTLSELMAKIWPGRSSEFMKCLKRLRDEGSVRFEKLQVDPQDKVRFQTSIIDCMREADLMFGPCGIRAVDTIIGELKSPLSGVAA